MKVAEQVSQKLLALIENRTLQVGDKLPAERQLCEELQVSRSSLREAISQLNQAGVLASRVGSGTYVEKLTGQKWFDQQIILPLTPFLDTDPLYRVDVQEARVILEGGTAWYAAQRATSEDKAHIHQFYDELAFYQAQGDAEKAAQADANFHLAIAEASHNLVLLQMMRSVFDLLQYNVVQARRKIYTNAYGFEQLHLQHAQVMHAIDIQDPNLARESVCEHIEFVIQQVHVIDETEARIQRSSRLKGAN